MKSKIFDPLSNDEIREIDETKHGKPFMRKLLKKEHYNSRCPLQKVEILISQIITNNPHKNIVDIYAIKLPDEGNDGYIDSELLEPLEEQHGGIIKKNKEHINMIEKHIEDSLSHLHKNNIVYIDLHAGNVGWSEKDKCWKIFDFNMSGIAKPNTNEWLHEPSRGIYYNVMLQQNDILRYDDIAKSLFIKEKNRLLNKTI